MKIRIVKKAIKALKEGRNTPLLKKVRLNNVVYFAHNKDHNETKRNI